MGRGWWGRVSTDITLAFSHRIGGGGGGVGATRDQYQLIWHEVRKRRVCVRMVEWLGE